MQIIGTSEGARSLSNGIERTTIEIYELTNNIKQQVQALESSFRDSGFSDVQDVVMGIYQSIKAHLEDVKTVTNALDKYADLLERRG